MSKEQKKKSPMDEKIDLGMSFNDALRLAAKTAPPMTASLELNKEFFLENVAGKTVVFDSIEIKGNKADNFVLQLRFTTGKDSMTQPMPISQVDSEKITDNIFKLDKYVSVDSTEIMHVRIEPTNVTKDPTFTSCKLTYWVNETLSQ